MPTFKSGPNHADADADADQPKNGCRDQFAEYFVVHREQKIDPNRTAISLKIQKRALQKTPNANDNTPIAVNDMPLDGSVSSLMRCPFLKLVLVWRIAIYLFRTC